ncbi:hypothetical protein ACFSCX_09660 [Bacillus salitolerans]|uniref:Transposase n=1 Tax=Bacillus salitolerans TaxID=1437434 RepID=A0ABW4LP49_9BACI
MRKQVATACDTLPIRKGGKTRHRYGTYNSLYKWSFDFKIEFNEVMGIVEGIMDETKKILV